MENIQEPEERQNVTVERFQRTNRAGRTFAFPNLSKQSKVTSKRLLQQDNCWQLSERLGAVSVSTMGSNKHANLKCF